jgi:hypothetical protein
VTPQIHNQNGWVRDVHILNALNVEWSHVTDQPGGAVTLLADMLWMTDVGKFAGKDLTAFHGVVNPLNWDQCAATKSFFVQMVELNPHRGWPKEINETVALNPASPNATVTAHLEFSYDPTPPLVQNAFHLLTQGEIVVDRGWVKATKISYSVPDGTGALVPVDFFRFSSKKTVKFLDGHHASDFALKTFWGYAALRFMDCAG